MLPLAALVCSADPQPTLKEAIAAYEQLDDAKAMMAFQTVLATEPAGEVAAKAHLYLGLIAFNAIHPDLARSEFKKAIRANPAIDVPPDTSPKATLAFSAARLEVIDDVAKHGRSSVPAEGTRVGAVSAPEAAVQPGVETEVSPPHSHWLSIALGGGGLVLGVVAAIGGAQVIQYNSVVGSGNAQYAMNGTATAGTKATSLEGAANFWRYAWIPFAAGAAVAVTAGVLTW